MGIGMPNNFALIKEKILMKFYVTLIKKRYTRVSDLNRVFIRQTHKCLSGQYY